MSRWSSPFDHRLRTAGCVQHTSSDTRRGCYVQHTLPAAGSSRLCSTDPMQDPVRKAQPVEPSVQLTSSPRPQAVQQPASWIATNCAVTHVHVNTADHNEHHQNTHRTTYTYI